MVGSGEGEDELYEQLWKGCAGPLVDVPRVGQRVFYFPQGHMEQVSFSQLKKIICFYFVCNYGILILFYFIVYFERFEDKTMRVV